MGLKTLPLLPYLSHISTSAVSDRKQVSGDLDGWDLTSGKVLWIEGYETVDVSRIKRTRRIVIDYAMSEHRDPTLRFLVR